MSQLNRKAVSIMVGYVLLIAIAVALSTAVFFYLKLYLPDERPECNVDIKLMIDYASCYKNLDGNQLIDINITNRGFFKVEGAYVKIGDIGRVFKTDLNPSLSISECNGDYALNPGKTSCKTFPTSSLSGLKELSVQPVVYINNEPVLCSEAVVTKRVVCS
jgi:hypothetical protein